MLPSAEFESAAAQIEAVACALLFLGPKNVAMERIDHIFALLLVRHESGMAQHTEVVRDIDEFLTQKRRQLADISSGHSWRH